MGAGALSQGPATRLAIQRVGPMLIPIQCWTEDRRQRKAGRGTAWQKVSHSLSPALTWRLLEHPLQPQDKPEGAPNPDFRLDCLNKEQAMQARDYANEPTSLVRSALTASPPRSSLRGASRSAQVPLLVLAEGQGTHTRTSLEGSGTMAGRHLGPWEPAGLAGSLWAPGHGREQRHLRH